MATNAAIEHDDHTIELGDGRKLTYVEVGDPSGYPLLSCHGGLSSRLDILPAAEAAAAHGLRIVCPDRPGIGRSDRLPDRTLLDWPADVVELTAHLGIDRFAVMGWSLGGIYAQACASALADRVSVVALVASGIPPDWDGMREEINRMDRIFMKLAGSAPGVERTIFHLMHLAAARAPKAFAKEMKLTGELATQLPPAIAEGLTDVEGVVEDYRVFASPWGFSPTDIELPVQIWQGDADDLVPPAWGTRLRDAIPGSSLTVVPGASHFLWYDHWDEIFDGIRTVVA